MSSKVTYSVVVRNPNSWTENNDGSNREYEITAHCGHAHQTLATAQACMDRLTAWYCMCGERSNAYHRRCSSSTGHKADHTSARWYNAAIEEHKTNETPLYAVVQEGCCIFGVGRTLKAAVIHANKWLERWDHVKVSQLAPLPYSGAIHGAMYYARITPALAAQVLDIGGTVVWNTLEDGTLCTKAEAA